MVRFLIKFWNYNWEKRSIRSPPAARIAPQICANADAMFGNQWIAQTIHLRREWRRPLLRSIKTQSIKNWFWPRVSVCAPLANLFICTQIGCSFANWNKCPNEAVARRINHRSSRLCVAPPRISKSTILKHSICMRARSHTARSRHSFRPLFLYLYSANMSTLKLKGQANRREMSIEHPKHTTSKV